MMAKAQCYSFHGGGFFSEVFVKMLGCQIFSIFVSLGDYEENGIGVASSVRVM